MDDKIVEKSTKVLNCTKFVYLIILCGQWLEQQQIETNNRVSNQKQTHRTYHIDSKIWWNEQILRLLCMAK